MKRVAAAPAVMVFVFGCVCIAVLQHFLLPWQRYGKTVTAVFIKLLG